MIGALPATSLRRSPTGRGSTKTRPPVIPSLGATAPILNLKQ